jgi:hypothetical protein
VARNRYGQAKRAKEIARKQKKAEKLKRRQNKAEAESKENTSMTVEEGR